MDVRSTPPGMMPYLSHRASLPSRALLHGRTAMPDASPPPVTGGGDASVQPLGQAPEIGGVPDGPDIVLASGVHIRRLRIGGARVGNQQLLEAIRGVQLLPLADQQLVARLGLPIELVPVTQLERMPGATAPVVGATRVTGSDGSARAERIRIAAFQAQVGSSVREATEHEIGHVIAVTTRQDLSEDAAIRYAARY